MLSIGMALILAACGKPEPAPEARQVTTRAAAVAPPAAVVEPTAVTAAWRAHLPEITDDQVPMTLKRASEALLRGQLERRASPGPGALELYLSVLLVDPASESARQGVQACLDALVERGTVAMRFGLLPEAARIEKIVSSVQPDHPALVSYRDALRGAWAAQRLVDKARAQAKTGKIARPGGDDALQSLRKALEERPGYVPAIEELSRWHVHLLGAAWKAAKADDFRDADALLLEAHRMGVEGSQDELTALRIVELRQDRTETMLAQGNALVDRLRLDEADRALRQVARIAAQPARVDALRERIRLARHYGSFLPGQAFSDPLVGGGRGPEMVVVPYGSFTMGSADKERGRSSNEGPAHAVAFARGFAIGTSEVTVAQFGRFIAATGYRTLAARRGSYVYDEKGGVMAAREDVDWRRDYAGGAAASTMPVVHVALRDAVTYAQWLSKQTKQHYRLPSEAEFEYVLRAGSAASYAWSGDSVPRRVVGNLAGQGDKSASGRRWDNAVPGYRDGFWGPSPVKSFPREGFGTFDSIGNVSEWTQDCWHDSYRRAPVDGTAWINPGCKLGVVRGASWASSLDQARSAFRTPMPADLTSGRLGFRIVREL